MMYLLSMTKLTGGGGWEESAHTCFLRHEEKFHKFRRPVPTSSNQITVPVLSNDESEPPTSNPQHSHEIQTTEKRKTQKYSQSENYRCRTSVSRDICPTRRAILKRPAKFTNHIQVQQRLILRTDCTSRQMYRQCIRPAQINHWRSLWLCRYSDKATRWTMGRMVLGDPSASFWGLISRQYSG